MTRKTIYTRERIDVETGELVLDINVTAAKNNETFMFARTTDGISWVKNFKNLQDVLVLVYMVEFEEIRSGVVIFTGTQIKSCSEFYGVSEKTIRNSISSLINTGFIKRISCNNFVINPCTFYRGGVVSFIRKMHQWNIIKEEGK
jgi:hypothetical protein